MDFGFTNDEKRIQAAREYRDAAVADGWSIEPTYKTESVDRAAKLRRDGYVMSILTREGESGKWRFTVKVSIWGPDDLAIQPPEKYDFAEIERRAKRCNYCGNFVEKTERVGFAGRCCESCLPAVRAKVEYPGWCN